MSPESLCLPIRTWLCQEAAAVQTVCAQGASLGGSGCGKRRIDPRHAAHAGGDVRAAVCVAVVQRRMRARDLGERKAMQFQEASSLLSEVTSEVYLPTEGTTYGSVSACMRCSDAYCSHVHQPDFPTSFICCWLSTSCCCCCCCTPQPSVLVSLALPG